MVATKQRDDVDTKPRNRPDPALVREEMHRSIIFTVIATIVLLVIGVVMVYSATAPSGFRDVVVRGKSNPFAVANLQLIYAVAGVILAVIAALIPMRFYQRFAPWLFAMGIGLQALVRSPLGHNVGGNTNWLRIGPVGLQPSEFLKLATIVFLAAYLAKIRPDTATGRDYLLPAGAGAVVGVFAIMLGQDMGTALAYTMICVGIFWMARLQVRYFVGLLGFGAVGAGVLVAMAPTRLQRVSEYFGNLFTLPDAHAPTQQDFALWAFGSGGIGGSGLGTGAEKWPGNMAEAQTDFIFAVIGEELGLGGCLVVVGLFGLLGWSLFKICRFHPDRFARFVAGGVAIWLTGQAVVNMMVVTGLLPVFGIPLPFISQGGSSVVACLLGVGVALSCALSVPGVRESFRVRRGLAYRARALVRRNTHD